MAGGSSQSSNPVEVTPEVFKGLQDNFATQISKMLGRGSRQFDYANGTLAAPITANETSIIDQLMGILGQSSGASGAAQGLANAGQLASQAGKAAGSSLASGSDYTNTAASLLGKAGNTVTSGVNPIQSAIDYYSRVTGGEFLDTGNPFLQSAIQAAQRPTLQGLEESLSRSLPGRFTAEGGQFVQPQGSSAFDRAAALATRGVSQSIADIATNMGFGAYESERGRMGEAAAGLTDAGTALGQLGATQGQIGLGYDQLTNTQTNRAHTQNTDQIARANALNDTAKTAADVAAASTQITAQDVDNHIKTLQAAALPRLIEEYGIERGMTEFQNRTTAYLDLLKLVGATTAPTVGQQSQGEEKPNILGPLLAAL